MLDRNPGKKIRPSRALFESESAAFVGEGWWWMWAMVDPSSDLGGRYCVGGSSNAAHVIKLKPIPAHNGNGESEETFGGTSAAAANAATACRRWRRRWSWRTTMV